MLKVADSDSLYSRVLRELYSPAWLRKSERESYALVAKELGVDDQTVRSIVARMQDSGFLKGWTISLNPRALGMLCGTALVKVGESAAPSKDRVVSQLQDIEGLVAIFTFLDDPGFRLVFFYDDDQDFDRKTRLISSICGVTRSYVSWEIPFPESNKKLKKTDWQIIRTLLKDSRKSASEIAAEIGVSTRTARRRLEALAADNSFFPSPIVDVKRIDGFLYHFVISYADKKDKAVADGLLRRKIRGIIFADTNADLHTVIGSVCQNISEARQISDWLRAQRGTVEVTARVFEEIIYVHNWIDHEVEKRLRA
jgi:DNA-binding Lrp family transcriptional regulator